LQRKAQRSQRTSQNPILCTNARVYSRRLF